MSTPMRVALVEDNPRYRRSLETFLSHVSGFSVADCFDAPEPALRQLAERVSRGQDSGWDLVLIDLELPVLDGIEATRRIKQLVPGLPVVALTVFEDPGTIVRAICAGVDGYLLKKSSTTELMGQLRAIAGGGSPLTSEVARKVLDVVRRTTPATERAGTQPRRLSLTEREHQTLQGLVRGLSYKEVADELGVSLDTVRSHVRSVYAKLQVHSVAEAVSRAIRDGMV